MLRSVSLTDTRLCGLAAGFTLGFGIWTATVAVKQTRVCKHPRRSIFIYMVWGEITVNFLMGILAWLGINGVIPENLTFFILVTTFWVFQVQLYFQIIINRCGVVADNKDMIKKLKVITAVLITLINISVYIIWIPAQVKPPPIPILVSVNKYWDRTSKGILLIIDAGLNVYFLHTVRQTLVKDHGLVKYKPLIHFNAWLMLVSVSMDGLLIGVETISINTDSVVFEQFHPLVYNVKLHIELSMAALITKLAKRSADDLIYEFYNSNHGQPLSTQPESDLPTIPSLSLPSPTIPFDSADKSIPMAQTLDISTAEKGIATVMVRSRCQGSSDEEITPVPPR